MARSQTFEFDNSLKKEMKDRYEQSQPLTTQWQQQADIDTKMSVGQQDYLNKLYTTNTRNSAGLLQFNKILRALNLISGYQRKNRNVTIASPVENADAETSDQLTGCLYWSKNRDNTYEKISDCFYGACVTGFTLLNVWMDYREDPESGDIKSIRVPYNAFMMDPYWKNSDLSDCDWIWQRSYRTTQQVLATYPKIKKDLASMNTQQGQNDGRFMYMPENQQMYNKNLWAYDEYWTREYKTVKKLLNKVTNEVIDYPKNMDDEREEILRRFNPNVEIIKAQAPTVKLHVLINNNLVYEEESPYGIDKYPYIPFLCYFNPEVQDYAYRYMGIVRNIRDSQIELNRRRNKMLDILDSQVNSGMIVKEDALVDPEDAFLSGQGRVMYLKDTATMADIQPIPAPQIPPSMFEMQKLMDEEITSIAGITDELFGESDDKSMSGFLTQLRMGAGLVSLQPIFDRLNSAQKALGELWISLIQGNFSSGKVHRILNKEPTQQFKDGSFQKYDCVVEEGILTSTQKQLQFIQLLQMKQMDIPIPTQLLIEASTLQNKKELIEAIQAQEQQAAQTQQMQMQQAMQKEAVLTRSLEAKAQNDFASAQERQTRAISNIGLAKERSAEAIHDRAKAALDNIMAVAKLQELDENRLMSLANFITELQMKQRVADEGFTGDATQEAAVVGQDVEMAKQQSAVAVQPQPQGQPGQVGQEQLVAM